MTAAIAGIDSRMDENGVSVPWHLAVYVPGSEQRFGWTGALPYDRKWMAPPRDALYGDLVTSDEPQIASQTPDIAAALLAAGIDEIIIIGRWSAPELFDNLEALGIRIVENDDANALMERPEFITRAAILPFHANAGKEIEALLEQMGISV